jgi:thiol-disulfide isomerase/thioredoxin
MPAMCRSSSSLLSGALVAGLLCVAGAAAAGRGGPVVPANAARIQALAALPGARATLVNVWATWCAPCKKEFPALLSVAHGHARDGLRLVLVSADFDDQLPAVKRFLAAHGVADTSYIKGENDMSFINTLNPKWSGALPATFLYDGEGRLAAFWEGAADSARFQREVTRVLAGDTKEDSRP